MDPILFLGSAIVLVAILYVLWPVWKSDQPLLDDSSILTDRDRQELLDRKATLLAAIKDMEFDFRIGKLSEDDYTVLVDEYKRQAAIILGRLERQDDELEQLIAAARERIVKSRTTNTESAHTAKVTEEVETICPACQTVNPNQARFCMSCGASLVTE